MTPLLAAAIWFGSMILFAIGDIYLVTDHIKGNTWSEVTRLWAERSIVIPWSMGVLCGHWFHWFNEHKTTYSANKLITLLILSVFVLFIGMILHNLVKPFPNWMLMVTLQLGIIAGVVFWRI